MTLKREADGIVPTLTTDNIGEKLYIRIERQTLTRLQSRLRTVRHSHIHQPAGRRMYGQGACRQHDEGIEDHTREMLDYKSYLPIEDALLGYLSRHA